MIISVASGKGGTGKTLVATSLALSLKDREKVQLLDCDVEEPDAHIFLKPTITCCESVSIQVPEVDAQRCTYCGKCAEVCAYHAIAVLQGHVLVFSQLCHGCGACSYLCPEKAISETGREMGIVEWGYFDNVEFAHGKLAIAEAMPTPVIKKVKEKASREGVVIIDVSPGTSCPVVESIKDSDFCLLVTEPTPFGLNDLILAVETARKLGIPCGVVINRDGVGDKKVEQYCVEENIPIMLTIPMNSGIARLYSKGITLVEGLPNWKKDFVRLFDSIGEIVRERTCSLKR
jgi:MinD superfamily P-loop ATPase